MFTPSDGPIFVGLSGPAGSGKTSTADAIAPLKKPTERDAAGGVPPVLFSHRTLASPIYDVVTTKRVIQGPDADNRQLHELHAIASDLLGRGIPYDDLIEFVYDLHAMDAGREGQPKPRTFMQTVGDMFRAKNEDCFVDRVIRNARADFQDTLEDYENADRDPFFFVLVSDVRRLNEIARLQQQPCVLVRLEATRETVNGRMFNRDGSSMSEEQWNHPTETELNKFEGWDLVVDTNNLTLGEQATEVATYLIELTGLGVTNA